MASIFMGSSNYSGGTLKFEVIFLLLLDPMQETTDVHFILGELDICGSDSDTDVDLI